MGAFVPSALKSTTVRMVAVMAVVLGLYAVAGFWVAPTLIRSALIENIDNQIGVTPSIGEIHVNPLLLQVELTDVALPDPAGARLVGFGRLFVDVSPSSLWRGALVFKTIDIDAPFVNAVVAGDGSLNLLRLKPKPRPAPSGSHPGGGPPTIRVGSFHVSRGLVSYEDLSRASHFSTRLAPVDIDLRDFSTSVDGQDGRFTFTGSSKLGERIEWRGSLGVQPIQSDGELRIEGLRAHTVWEYLADQLGFMVDSGTIDVAATYRFAIKDAVEFKVDVSRFALVDLGIRSRAAAPADDCILVPGLTVTGASADWGSRVVKVDSVALNGVKLATWLNPDKSFNLSQLAAAPSPRRSSTSASVSSEPAAQGADAASKSSREPAVAASAPPPWHVDLREFSFQAASIVAEDRSLNPAARLMLAPVSLRVTGVSEDLRKPVSVALDVSVNGPGRVQVQGQVWPQPLSADLAVNLTALDLKALQPYLQQYTSMTLQGGRLSADAKVRYGAATPALLINGNMRVEQLHTVDNALGDDFISWDRLDVSGIRYAHGPDRLTIDSVVARKPYARIIIESDASLNVKRVLTAADASGAVRGATATASAATVTGKPPDAKAATRACTARCDNLGHGKAPSATPTMPVVIRKIVLHAGQANFSDLTVQPNFSAGIQSLEGSVTGLSSKPDSRATIDLHGQVDAFAPVLISGRANVLSDKLYTDVAMSFKNMELTMFNPYSGKFAGYDITKGKLTTEFHYQVDGRKLDAQHHVIVDQLEFGEKTDSKYAVSLPVKLAVSLLKDRNGVIDLQLPVTGSLDDPQFRLAPLIWKVLMSVLVKAVTAPFALLGSLFGGGPDMQFIDFEPGVAALDASAMERVKAVAKVLVERPELKIEVPIAALPLIDRPALVESRFKAELNDPALHAGKAVAPGAPYDRLEPRAQLALLTALYTKDFGTAPRFPGPDSPPAQAEDQRLAEQVDYLKHELKGHLVVPDADLRTLAEQRATMVQQSLLDGTQIDPARIFLVVNDKATVTDGRARLELALQ